jgi:uncharacterized protein (DUF2236 family)
VSVPTSYISPALRDMAALSAEELTARLARYFESIGGLSTESDRAIARELVRRARLLDRRDQARR